jgi:hypothetical protein
MGSDQVSIRSDRGALKLKYGVLFERVSVILFKADLMGINFESNTDEYDPEVGTILPRLGQAKSVPDVAVIVHEEFCRWFGVEESFAVEHYRDVAEQIWSEWNVFNQRQD